MAAADLVQLVCAAAVVLGAAGLVGVASAAGGDLAGTPAPVPALILSGALPRCWADPVQLRRSCILCRAALRAGSAAGAMISGELPRLPR